jgi:long-chain acyl-CoA synthetase
VDEDGDFVIVDRKKDLIIRGGYNVYPREVEEALYAHPAVAEAAVIGVPDARLGEEVKAVIAFRPGMSATAEQIVQHCKTLVAAYKYPRIVTILDALPKGPTGKNNRYPVARGTAFGLAATFGRSAQTASGA